VSRLERVLQLMAVAGKSIGEVIEYSPDELIFVPSSSDNPFRFAPFAYLRQDQYEHTVFSLPFEVPLASACAAFRFEYPRTFITSVLERRDDNGQPLVKYRWSKPRRTSSIMIERKSLVEFYKRTCNWTSPPKQPSA
jgi:hypothetical protein